jgi:hypothetical protein
MRTHGAIAGHLNQGKGSGGSTKLVPLSGERLAGADTRVTWLACQVAGATWAACACFLGSGDGLNSLTTSRNMAIITSKTRNAKTRQGIFASLFL